MPLSNHVSGVANFLKALRERDHIQRKAVGLTWPDDGVLEACVYLIPACDELAAGRRAQRLDIVVLQPDPLRGQLIQRRAADLAAVVADVIEALVVGQNKDDMWRLLGLERCSVWIFFNPKTLDVLSVGSHGRTRWKTENEEHQQSHIHFRKSGHSVEVLISFVKA